MDIRKRIGSLLMGERQMIHHDSANSDPPAFKDDVLKQMYAETNVPCDTLVSDPERLSAFAQDYTQRTAQEVEPAQLAHRLLTLRKLGESKGGLPRLRRKLVGEFDVLRMESRHGEQNFVLG